MEFNLWFVVIGGLLVLMALAGSMVKRLPLTPSMFYLAIGFGLGPAGLGMLRLDPLDDSVLLERLSEVVVIISLFSAGLKLRTPFTDRRWRIPVRLATLSMLLTVALIAATGYWLLGLPLGAAVLLGAVLAPTDPVLASDVQVERPNDRDRLRFGLTGEAGLNDGTAFPFVMLGLGLLGLHELGPSGLRWLAVDVVWAVAAGLTIGWLAGTLVGRLVLYLRRTHREAIGLDDFLALGLIALSYGVALLAHSYGFLAVFAAGLALRRVEMTHSEAEPDELLKQASAGTSAEEMATDPQRAPAYMAHAVLGFNEQLERIGEVAMMVLAGGLLATIVWLPQALWFVPLLLLLIRPLSAALGLVGAEVGPLQRRLIGWFGIRGVGSIYYLMFAITHGLADDSARTLLSLTLITITVSVVVHGISVTPLMEYYQRRITAQDGRPEPAESVENLA
jgi:sodium/hydrogen antiporter